MSLITNNIFLNISILSPYFPQPGSRFIIFNSSSYRIFLTSIKNFYIILQKQNLFINLHTSNYRTQPKGFLKVE